MRLLPSTSGDAIWPVHPQGCTNKDPQDCSETRGAFFNPDNSSTWDDIGLYQLGLIQEKPLGYSGNATIGYDDVRLGIADASTPVAPHQVVEGFATKDFYLGSLGLKANAVNISSFQNSTKSFLASLKDQNTIPSLSWGYTAGASYAQPPAFGSLTLGGYDSSRFEPNDISFPFGPDKNRELVVYVKSVSSYATLETVLPVDIYGVLDSLVPDFWLPASLCQKFEDSFQLQYNSTLNRYFLNDTAHDALTKLNARISWLLSTGPNSPIVNVTMPYASFDLVDKAPSLGKGDGGARYFPLRQAANSTQHTIGRTFFQNAYVIADWERANFSVHQAVLPDLNTKQNIVAISSSNSTAATNEKKPLPAKSGGLSKGAIAGIVVPIVVAVLAAIAGLVWWLRRRQNAAKAANSQAGSSQEEFRKAEMDGDAVIKAELSGDSNSSKAELAGKDELLKQELSGEVPHWKSELAGEKPRAKIELPASPGGHEADAGVVGNEADAGVVGHEADAGVVGCEADAGVAGKELEGSTPVNSPTSPTELSESGQSSIPELSSRGRHSLISPITPSTGARTSRAELEG